MERRHALVHPVPLFGGSADDYAFSPDDLRAVRELREIYRSVGYRLPVSEEREILRFFHEGRFVTFLMALDQFTQPLTIH